MKTNTSNIPPAPVSFDCITLHDAMVRKVTDHSPPPEMSENWALIGIPGKYRLDAVFSLDVKMYVHGIWVYGIFIRSDLVVSGIASVLDEKALPLWLGISQEIERVELPALIEAGPPDYLRRFKAIRPNQGFLTVQTRSALAKYPSEWSSLTPLLYDIYWRTHAETARLSVSGQIPIEP